MRKFIFALFVISLFSFLLVSAAEVRFVAPTPIVKDVPFNFDVEMNSNDVSIARIQFYITSSRGNADFLSSSRSGVWLQDSLVNQNLAESAGKVWKYNVGPKGAVNEKTTTFKRVLTLSARTKADDSLTLRALDNLIAQYPTGAPVEFTLPSLTIPTALSACGDGVVGYFDADSDGVKDTNEKDEACDTGAAPNSGCHACEYIEIGYKGTNCGFGSRTCSVTQMEPRELLREKLNALLSNQCYPNAQHPNKLYCDNTGTFEVDYANFNQGTKISLIAKIAAALTEYFTSVLPT